MPRLLFCLFFLSYATNAFSQVKDKIVEVSGSTFEYCKAHDFAPFLMTNEKYGNTGVFDKDFGRLQIHFESVKRDEANPTRYYVTGASRHLKNVTAFRGSIVITDVKRKTGGLANMLSYMPGNNGDPDRMLPVDESSPYVVVTATYNFREDSAQKFSGEFTGDLVFALKEDDLSRLSNDWNRTENEFFRNFIYRGKWTSHDGKFSANATWADGRIPVPKGVDVGENEFTIAPKYEKGGWKKDADGRFVDNPEYWWRTK